MVHVLETITLAANPDAVWSVIGDFGTLHDWHPMIAECRMRDNAPSDQIGGIRELSLANGARVVETLTARSEDGRSYSYDFVESPFPISNYLSTIRVRRGEEDGQSVIEWEAEFETPPEAEQEMAGAISAVYTSGFEALAARFGG